MEDDGIGLVLSGGGAKGAYQAGVWKALVECGVANRIKAVSGTSVGAINACAFTQVRDPEAVKSLWLDNIEGMATPNFAALAPENILLLMAALTAGKPFPFKGLLDRSRLETVLDSALPGEWRRDSPATYATSLRCEGDALECLSPAAYRLVRFGLDAVTPRDEKLRRVLASCAIPGGFDPVEIDGAQHVDGGWTEMGGDNVPLAPILECHSELKTIVVVMCNGPDKDFTKVEVPEGVKLVMVRPSMQMPGAFDGILAPAEQLARLLGRPNPIVWSGTLSFFQDYARLYFERGYRDALAKFPMQRKRLQLDI